MARTIFKMGVADGAPWAGMPSGIPIHRGMTREEVDRDRAKVLRRLPVPPNMSVGYPYVVKIDEGEYLVQIDGTASFYSYRYGRWEPAEPVDNASAWTRSAR